MSDEVSLSRYRILDRLGAGGMGVVHRAIDTETGQEVALKIGNVPSDAAASERFFREMRHASAVRHPNVCSVLGSGKTYDGSVFLVMELMSGLSLTDLARTRRAAPSIWLETLRSLAAGLEAVHAKGIVHRDVKPSNVMFDASGTLKLLDFGIARSSQDETVTGTGMVIGTTAYMSPEQARAEDIDPRSDLFSAGLTAMALASRGASRFATTKLDALQKLLAAGTVLPPLLVDVEPATPPEVEDLFEAHLMTLHPHERIGSARELIAVIDACPVRHKDGEALLRRWVLGEVGDEEVLKRDAEREVKRALAMPPDIDSQVARVLAWRRASLLDPKPETLKALQAEATRGNFRFDAEFDTMELDRLDKAARLDASALRRGYENFRRSGHIEVAMRLLWAYVRTRPDDVAMARTLERSMFGRAEGEAAQSRATLSLVRGIKTGGMKAMEKAARGEAAALSTIQAQPNTATMTRNDRQKGGGAPSPLPGPSASRFEERPTAQRRPAPVTDDGGTSRKLGVLAVAGATLVVALLLFQTMRAAREEMKAQGGVVDKIETRTVVDEQVKLLGQAEQMLKDGDAPGAIDATTRLLGMKVSVETGRRALLLRARAHLKQLDRPAARRDLELYLARATDFADPGIVEAKQLLATMDDQNPVRPALE